MIRPTVGRIMWYWPEKSLRTDQPWPAMVAYVHNDNMVNLTIWNAAGNQQPGRTSIPVVQDGSPFSAGESPYVEWMPYQVNQAKKNEST